MPLASTRGGVGANSSSEMPVGTFGEFQLLSPTPGVASASHAQARSRTRHPLGVTRAHSWTNTHSDPEPSAWALPARTLMAAPLRCSRPGCSPRGSLPATALSGVDAREHAGLGPHSDSLPRSRARSGRSQRGGGYVALFFRMPVKKERSARNGHSHARPGPQPRRLPSVWGLRGTFPLLRGSRGSPALRVQLHAEPCLHLQAVILTPGLLTVASA